jgi:hypothetical protein
MVSPEGRQNFQNQLKQLIGSIQYSNDYDVHQALILAPSYAKTIDEKYYSESKNVFQRCREYVDLFGMLQKNPNALDLIIEEAKSTLRSWGSKEPTFLLTPSKLTMQLTMIPEKTEWIRQGPDGAKRLAEGPNLPSYRGVNIIHSRSFATEEGARPRDLLQRRVRVAEVYTVNNVKKGETGSVELYDQSRDQFFKITFDELFKHSTLDHYPDGAEDYDPSDEDDKGDGGDVGAAAGGGGPVGGGAAPADLPRADFPNDSISDSSGATTASYDDEYFGTRSNLKGDTIRKYITMLDKNFVRSCLRDMEAHFQLERTQFDKLKLKFDALMPEMSQYFILSSNPQQTAVWMSEVLSRSLRNPDEKVMLYPYLLDGLPLYTRYMQKFGDANGEFVERFKLSYNIFWLRMLFTSMFITLHYAHYALPRGEKLYYPTNFAITFQNNSDIMDIKYPFLELCQEIIEGRTGASADFGNGLDDDNFGEALRNKLRAKKINLLSKLLESDDDYMQYPEIVLLLFMYEEYDNGVNITSIKPKMASAADSWDFVIVRPAIEHNMLGVVMGRGGKDDLGATFWGQTELSVYDDAMHGNNPYALIFALFSVLFLSLSLSRARALSQLPLCFLRHIVFVKILKRTVGVCRKVGNELQIS